MAWDFETDPEYQKKLDWVDEFIDNHSHDVSKGGVFIKTATPFTTGTLLKFEIRLASDQAVIAGVGRVVWKRDAGTSMLQNAKSTLREAEGPVTGVSPVGMHLFEALNGAFSLPRERLKHPCQYQREYR